VRNAEQNSPKKPSFAPNVVPQNSKYAKTAVLKIRPLPIYAKIATLGF
jgi:hypothetical protein